MSIFVTGDVHGVAEYGASRFSSRVWPLGRTLTRDDVVIVAGDFGFIWSGSNTDKYWLDWFESKPWTTCLSTVITRITICWRGCRSESGTGASFTRPAHMCCT